MTRLFPASLALIGALAACGPTTDSPSYFDNLSDTSAVERNRQIQLLRQAEMNSNAPTTAEGTAQTAAQGMPAVPPLVISTEESTQTEAETIAQSVLDANTEEQTAPVATELAAAGNGDISSTQDFETITQRETIESDAAKLAALADSYQVVEPTALPTRKNEVNLAAYAINQTNQLGNKIYIRRSNGPSGCLGFVDQDEAQRRFLSSGGPKMDPHNLDRDGDGFACKWTPDAYRRLVQ